MGLQSALSRYFKSVCTDWKLEQKVFSKRLEKKSMIMIIKAIIIIIQ